MYVQMCIRDRCKALAKTISSPLTEDIINELKSGDRVLLNGIIYTGRDSAHKRLVEMLNRNEELPVDLKGQVKMCIRDRDNCSRICLNI